MKKQEFVEIVSKEIGESKNRTKEILDGLDNATLKAFNSIEMDDKVPASNLYSIHKKLRKGRSGVSKLHGVEKEWKTEDKVVPNIKTGKRFEDNVEQ